MPVNVCVDSLIPQKSPTGLPMHWRGHVEFTHVPFVHVRMFDALVHCASPSCHVAVSTHCAPLPDSWHCSPAPQLKVDSCDDPFPVEVEQNWICVDDEQTPVGLTPWHGSFGFAHML